MQEIAIPCRFGAPFECRVCLPLSLVLRFVPMLRQVPGRGAPVVRFGASARGRGGAGCVCLAIRSLVVIIIGIAASIIIIIITVIIIVCTVVQKYQ